MISRSGVSEPSSLVRDREAFASVALGWIPVVIVGALPLWLGGMFHGPFGDFWNPGEQTQPLRFCMDYSTLGSSRCLDSQLPGLPL